MDKAVEEIRERLRVGFVYPVRPWTSNRCQKKVRLLVPALSDYISFDVGTN